MDQSLYIWHESNYYFVPTNLKDISNPLSTFRLVNPKDADAQFKWIYHKFFPSTFFLDLAHDTFTLGTVLEFDKKRRLCASFFSPILSFTSALLIEYLRAYGRGEKTPYLFSNTIYFRYTHSPICIIPIYSIYIHTRRPEEFSFSTALQNTSIFQFLRKLRWYI